MIEPRQRIGGSIVHSIQKCTNDFSAAHYYFVVYRHQHGAADVHPAADLVGRPAVDSSLLLLKLHGWLVVTRSAALVGNLGTKKQWHYLLAKLFG